MFNIAQFMKFDLLLLINVMTHHRVEWEHVVGPPPNHFLYAVGVARAGAEEGWNEGHRRCLGLDLRFA